VVSTPVGAEGLAVTPSADILLADDPGLFASYCLALLDSPSTRFSQAERAREMVRANFSWSRVAAVFEEVLRKAARRNVLADTAF
jgi:glycosyltransferase involved in cell wall biosynthesis